MTRIQQLIAIVSKVAKVRGRKADLARYCGVLPSQVSEWLAGRAEPGANAALLMLDWLADTDPSAWSLYGVRVRK